MERTRRRALGWERQSRGTIVLAFILFLALSLGGAPTFAQPGEAVDQRIEKAVTIDFATVRKLFEFSKRMDNVREPETEEEIVEWVQNAQKIRAEMIELTNEGYTTRDELLELVKRGDLKGECPLVQSVVRYFETENEFFRLAEKAQESTTVIFLNSQAVSPDDIQKMRVVSELGEAALKSYDTLLRCQQDLISKAGARGLELSPVWDPDEQDSMLEFYRAMRDRLKGLEKK